MENFIFCAVDVIVLSSRDFDKRSWLHGSKGCVHQVWTKGRYEGTESLETNLKRSNAVIVLKSNYFEKRFTYMLARAESLENNLTGPDNII